MRHYTVLKQRINFCVLFAALLVLVSMLLCVSCGMQLKWQQEEDEWELGCRSNPAPCLKQEIPVLESRIERKQRQLAHYKPVIQSYLDCEDDPDCTKKYMGQLDNMDRTQKELAELRKELRAKERKLAQLEHSQDGSNNGGSGGGSSGGSW